MSEQPTLSRLPDRLTDLPIFDADSHWAEPGDLWTSRAPEKFKDQVMHVETGPSGTQFWTLEGQRLSPLGPSVVDKDLSKVYGISSLPTYDSMARGAVYTEERLDVLDQLGVGSQIVYPNAIGFGAARMIKFGRSEELKLFHVHAYNDAIADMQKESGSRLLGQMVLPLWNIEESIKEMKRCRKMGLTGISMSDRPQDWGQAMLPDPAWAPFWEEVQELDVPVNFHIASGDWAESHFADGIWGEDQLRLDDSDGLLYNGKVAAYQSTVLFTGNQKTVLNLILSGLLDLYPRIKYISVESGLGWVPFTIQALELNYRELMRPEERALFKREPRQAFIDQIYMTYWFEDKGNLELYIKNFGSDNVMFETDFPHPVSMYPDAQGAISRTLADQPDNVRRDIMYRNAERVYGVPVGKIPARTARAA